MRTTILAIALALQGTTAFATTITTRCQHYWNSDQCTTRFDRREDTEPLPITAADYADIEEVTRVWALACKPKRVIGSDGLARYVYARKNCDIGRLDGEKR